MPETYSLIREHLFCGVRGPYPEEALLVYVVVQFYPWFNFYFPLFWGMVIYDNEFETKGNKN